VDDAVSAAAEFARGVNEARDARAMSQLVRTGSTGAAAEASLAAATTTTGSGGTGGGGAGK